MSVPFLRLSNSLASSLIPKEPTNAPHLLHILTEADSDQMR